LGVASCWEIVIKLALAKLKLTPPFSPLPDWLAANRMSLLPIEFTHQIELSTFRNIATRWIVCSQLSVCGKICGLYQ
jgi:PIN domain nuclease of toxin-antitoxin system